MSVAVYQYDEGCRVPASLLTHMYAYVPYTNVSLYQCLFVPYCAVLCRIVPYTNVSFYQCLFLFIPTSLLTIVSRDFVIIEHILRHRGLFTWEMRPIAISLPEVCVSVKRDLFIWQKRPIYLAKEAYLHGKWGLLILAYLRHTCLRSRIAPARNSTWPAVIHMHIVCQNLIHYTTRLCIHIRNT